MKVLMLIVCCLMNLPAQQAGYEGAKALYESDERPLSALQKLVDTHPLDPWAWHYLGRAEAASRRLGRAAKAIQQAVELDPKQSWHHVEMGRLHLRMNQPEQASRSFETAVSLEPDSEQRAAMQARSDRARSTTDHVAVARQRNIWVLCAIVLGGLILVAWTAKGRRLQ